MKTQPIKKRKIIDLPEDIFKRLSIRAAAEGTNLKSFIETLLSIEANSMSDEEMYKYMLQNDPEGKEAGSEEEQKNFRNWLDA
ncbi:MAG: hypothetical protein LUG18_03530 [Candidatus Azobacteroides sp.]|nr:hypothetical protein [Candidatus Azobacteroides sp.]